MHVNNLLACNEPSSKAVLCIKKQSVLLPTSAVEAVLRNGGTSIDHILVHSCILEWGKFYSWP